MEIDIEPLLEEARAYCKASNIKLSTLGYYALDDTRYFARLPKRTSEMLERAARIRAYMAANPPSQKDAS